MADSILEKVIGNTKVYLENMPKSLRKKKGQFFTSMETAMFMADMFDLSILPDNVSLLDPGTGSGILFAAVIDRLNKKGTCKSVHVTCYETDADIQPLLQQNIDIVKSMSDIPVKVELISDDYILSQKNDFNVNAFPSDAKNRYDLVISNPPYLRISRDDPAALAMPDVVHGAPNLYFLFASMSLFNLKNGSEMVYIIPRSWTSGLYFLYFRKYLLSVGKLLRIHLFVSRDKVFSEESVLQETIIIKVKKTKIVQPTVLITSSDSNCDFENIRSLAVPYSSVVVGKDLYVFLPTSEDELKAIETINRYSSTFPAEGLRMKTGIVVDFRNRDKLRTAPGDHIIPLFYSQHIRNGRVNHSHSGKEYDWIVDDTKGLIQDNKNYVFCKRFTAKEEKRRLQCGVYLYADFPEYSFIGTQNKINYVDSVDGSSMDLYTVYGVYALLNSTLFDTYYRVLNGSTQVNSTEVNSIPIPPINIIKHIGDLVMKSGDLSTDSCDKIVMEAAYYEQDRGSKNISA